MPLYIKFHPKFTEVKGAISNKTQVNYGQGIKAVPVLKVQGWDHEWEIGMFLRTMASHILQTQEGMFVSVQAES